MTLIGCSDSEPLDGVLAGALPAVFAFPAADPPIEDFDEAAELALGVRGGGLLPDVEVADLVFEALAAPAAVLLSGFDDGVLPS